MWTTVGRVSMAREGQANLRVSAVPLTSPFPQVSPELGFEVAELMRWQDRGGERERGLCLLTSFESDNAFQTGEFSGV